MSTASVRPDRGPVSSTGLHSIPIALNPVRSFDDVSADQVDAILAREMNQLSVQERNRIQEDVHGVAGVVEETEELVNRSIVNVEYWLSEILQPDDAYHRADAGYVRDRDFRLLFLRAALFDAREAAERMIMHFYFKEVLFGSDKLEADILPKDIADPEVAEAMQEAFFKLLPQLDAAGRKVFWSDIDEAMESSWDDMARPIWACIMLSVQDIEVQKRGVVDVIIQNSPNLFTDPELLLNIAALRYALPIRSAALHTCTYDSEINKISRAGRYFLDRPDRLRSRCHIGSQIQIHQTLRSFGIPAISLLPPCSTESHLFHRNFARGIAAIYSEIVSRRQQLMHSTSSDTSSDTSSLTMTWITQDNSERSTEESSDESSSLPSNQDSAPTAMINRISDNDVLSGRGKMRKHPGNVRMHKLVQEYTNNYRHSTKSGKTEVVKYVVRLIRESGGRFLKQAKEAFNCDAMDSATIATGWVELSDAEAREKVGKIFRAR